MALKVGAEDKKKVAIAIALAAVVVILLVWWVLPSFEASSAAPEPPPPSISQNPTPQTAARPAQPEAQTTGAHEAQMISGSMARLDPTLHPEWMAAAESLDYAGKGRNIFSMASAPVDIPKPVIPVRVADQPPPGPPPPPPIDLKFFGYEAHSGGDRKAFLLHGDDVFIAAVGDIVDHRYKIMQIAPLSIQVEDIPFNNTQTLPLVQN